MRSAGHLFMRCVYVILALLATQVAVVLAACALRKCRLRARRRGALDENVELMDEVSV